MYLILLLALSNHTPLHFKKTKIYCSDILYTWERPQTLTTGIKTAGSDYTSKYDYVDELDAEISRQCKKPKQ